MQHLTNSALVVAACTGLVAVAARPAAAQPAAATRQPPAYTRDVPDSLARQATVTEASALAAAQRRISRGRPVALELEREHGTLMYSFDFKVPARTGIDEVNVDAKSGVVLHVEHESPQQERREAAADVRAAKRRTGATAP
ncbi:MAG TPA: PepSY domain-containing protein [Gemmatirosa sp.]